MGVVDATEARLDSHEAVCAMRYEQINARLKRIETILLKATGVMLMSMTGVIFSAIWMIK